MYLVDSLTKVSGCRKSNINCSVDNKRLVDTMLCKNVGDRRLRIDVAVLNVMLERRGIDHVSSWVDTDQLADCITKKCDSIPGI